MQTPTEPILTIKWVEEIDSTNSEVLRTIDQWEDMQTLAAFNQTAGRGQRGNTWKIIAGQNLTFSTVLKADTEKEKGSLGLLPAREQFIISEIATIAVRDYLVSKGVDSKIKWPNDIYVGNKKICGMLIENGLSPKGHVAYSVIGIGININQTEFPSDLVNPTSVALQTKKTYDVQKELCEFVCILKDRLSLMNDREQTKKNYLDGLYRLGSWDSYTDCKSGEVFKGRITGITDEGFLEMEDELHSKRTYAFKEVSYII